MKCGRISPISKTKGMERDLERGEMRDGSCGGEDDERKRLTVLNLKSGRDLSSLSFPL